MWPSFNQCFPDPLSGQWPATQHPVLCECRQLYVLVSICCCLPSTHLLVLHEGRESSIVTSMPNGPTCVELRITEDTECDALCGFLLRAQTASLASVSSKFAESHSQQVTVVCLLGLAAASPSMLSAIMDVLVFGMVRFGNSTKRVPSLRIVAFCNAWGHASALPEYVRRAFMLSTYMSSLAMESPAVIQSTDRLSSNVVNRRHMLAVMHSPDSRALIDTVTLSGEVSHYLRHLLIVLRGSMVQHSAPGSCIPSRLPHMLEILKVVALLFTPSARAGSGRQHLMSLQLTTPTQRQLQQQYAFDAAPVTNLSHVIVSPAHVICFLCPFVAHLFTLRREILTFNSLTATKGIMEAGRRLQHPPAGTRNTTTPTAATARAGAEAATANAMAERGATRGGTMFYNSVDLWDARVLQWISHRGSSGDATLVSDVMLADAADFSATKDLTRVVRDYSEGFLSYPECRELVRATVMQRSAPPNG